VSGGPEDLERTQRIATSYDAIVDRYLALELRAEWPRLKWLWRALREVEPGASVLDLGCGNGLPATKAAAASYKVLGVDVSPRMIELARRNVPEADFRVSSIERLSFPEKSFAAVLAFYLFDHIPRDQLGDLLARIYGWLRPGGRFLATFEVQDEPGRFASWLGVQMYFSCYPPDRTKSLVQGAGFQIEEAEIESQTEGGNSVPYLWVVASRPTNWDRKPSNS
jgi:SAM-dependent methyltransferase